MTEATLWQAIPLQIAMFVSLASGEVEACFAQCSHTTSRADPEFHPSAGHAVGRHYRELCTAAHDRDGPSPVDGKSNLRGRRRRPNSNRRGNSFPIWTQLRDGMPLDCEIGSDISLPGNLDPTALDDACRDVRKARTVAGIGRFSRHRAVRSRNSRRPHRIILLLSETMLKGVTAGSQPLRRLQQVLATCQQFGITAVLPHFACQRTIAQCRQLGYELALQLATPATKTRTAETWSPWPANESTAKGRVGLGTP